MRIVNNLKIDEIEHYLNRIFDLQSDLRDKEFKIIRLELELSIEKQLLATFKKHYLPEDREVS